MKKGLSILLISAMIIGAFAVLPVTAEAGTGNVHYLLGTISSRGVENAFSMTKSNAFLAETSATEAPATEALAFARGDANHDGVIDIIDAMEILRWLAHIESDLYEQEAEVDIDGKLTTLDATCIQRSLAGLIDYGLALQLPDRHKEQIQDGTTCVIIDGEEYYVKVGDKFPFSTVLSIPVDTRVNALQGNVYYDPTRLELTTDLDTESKFYNFTNSDTQSGTLRYNFATATYKNSFDFNSEAALLTIEFKVIAEGRSEIVSEIPALSLINKDLSIDIYPDSGQVMLKSGITDIVTFLEDGSAAFNRYTGPGGDFEIPAVYQGSKVTRISNRAFADCASLTNVTIPDSVTSIGDGAFSGCSGLTSITIPETVTTIGDNAFSGCTSLTSVTIPDSVTRIGSGVFSGCTGLTALPHLSSKTEIGEYMFSGCTGLKSITLLDTIETIGKYAFADCTGLTDLMIPESVLAIDDHAFDGCTGLTNVALPDSDLSIGNYAFYNCNSMKKVTIPDNVRYIGDKAFGYYLYGELDKRVAGFTIYGYNRNYTVAQIYAQNNFDFIELVTKADDETGLTLDVPEDTDINVKKLDMQQAVGVAQELPEGTVAKSVYNISLSKNGSTVQPDHIVTAAIPCDNENAKVYRQEADGSLTDMNAKYVDGNMVFTTDHFSIYVLAVDGERLLGDTEGDGAVTILDATAIQRWLVNLKPEKFYENAADVDRKNGITILDATYIQRYLANLPSCEGINEPF